MEGYESPFSRVLREAFPTSEVLRSIAGQEAIYCGNCAGGRPSDNARTAARYVSRALAASDPSVLASPTATARMRDYLEGRTA